MAKNESYYESFLHSLTHEHTKGNVERHVLGYEKWCRKFADGILICDLDYVVQLIEILEQRLQSHSDLFQPVLISFLDICSKTLLESKGNERLRPIGIDRIKKYYAALTKFIQIGNLLCRTGCVKAFRCILNAGVDPTLIQEQQQPAALRDPSASVSAAVSPVLDKIFIQNLFRDSGAVSVIAYEFHSSYSKYSKHLKEIRKFQEGMNQTLKKKKKEPSPPASSSASASGNHEDFDENEDEGRGGREGEGAMTPTVRARSGSYDPEDTEDMTISMTDFSSSEQTFRRLKDVTFEYGEYCKLLVDLCLEISVDAPSACLLCDRGYACNALIIAISEELLNTRPDHSFISKLIELLWNCLENYVTALSSSTSGHAQRSPRDLVASSSMASPSVFPSASPSTMHLSSSLTTLHPSQSSQQMTRGNGEIIEFQHAIPTLRQLLRKLVFHGYCHSDKEIRNEVIIICHLLLSFPKSIPYFILSGLLNDLVTFATYGDMGQGRKGWTFYSQPLPKLRNFSTFTEIDIQFKKELWLLISELLSSDDQDIITCVASSPFLNVLFHYLEQSSFETDTGGEAGGGGGGGSEYDGSLEDGGAGAGGGVGGVTPTGISKSLLNKTTTLSLSRAGGGGGGGDRDYESSSVGSFSSQKKSTKLFSRTTGATVGASATPGAVSASATGGAAATGANKLPLTQLLELQILAMSILAGHAHRMMAEFIAIDGPRRSLSILCQYSSSSQSSDHKSLVYHTFLLLNRCLVTSVIVSEMLIELNGIEIFLSYFDSSSDSTSDSTTGPGPSSSSSSSSSAENISRAQAVKLLTAMCSSSLQCQKQLRDLGGIEVLVKALVRVSERKVPLVGKVSGVKFVTLNRNESDKYPLLNEETGGEMNVFAISLLCCVWKSIVGNRVNELIFADREGIDALFDMLEVSSFLIRSMILRLLSDLFQNRSLVSYAYAWRSSRTVRSIGQILAHAWMDEEVRLKCVRGEDGVVCDLWNILGNHSWPMDFIPPEPVFSETGEQLMAATSMAIASASASTSAVFGAPGGSPGDAGQSQIQSQSHIVKRLNSAISAARAGANSSHQLQAQVRTKVLSLDLRGIITTIFQSLGFLEMPVVNPELIGSDEYLSYVYDEMALDKQQDSTSKPKSGRSFLRSLSSMCGDTRPIVMSEEDMSDQNLSPTDKQVISICMRYDTLREGEWWNIILEELKQEQGSGQGQGQGVIPIDADLNMIEDMKERVFASARAIQFEQMELSVMRKMEKQGEEDVFFNHIIQQKNQQIKSEYLKRKSGRK